MVNPQFLADKLNEKTKLQQEADKIKENLSKSVVALGSEQANVDKLTALKDGETDLAARAQMLTTLDAAEKKVKDLQKHIDLGNKLVNTKQAKIAEVDALQKQANTDSHSQAQEINKYAKLAKDDQDKSNEALKATFAQEPKPVEETTQQELQAEAEQAAKIVEAERATSTKAQKTAEKLKPQVEDQET